LGFVALVELERVPHELLDVEIIPDLKFLIGAVDRKSVV